MFYYFIGGDPVFLLIVIKKEKLTDKSKRIIF
jgi:hypothetical protein